ncbi:hypothetical protein [Steroidobacter agaridevorans]|uniref:hypothetical protein n=1 Tax=Steroidobacter agaridevorans TaxID=2695856 RepID=UPI00137AD283|nr:hypothetical protein [Steroidobacter agaridevorans]
MGLLLLFVASFLVAFALQWFKRWWWLAAPLSSISFAALILLDEFVLPYRGGGASMWPIALLFGVPTAVAGSLFGLFFAWLFQPDRDSNNAL